MYPDNADPRRATARSPLLPAVLLGLALAAPVHAADESGQFAVKGAGATACGSYVQALEQKDQNTLYAYGGWIEGYVSASNQFLDDTYDIAPWETSQTLALLLANHCRNNPGVPFLTAVRQMVEALKEQRIERRSEVVEAAQDGRSIALYRETVRRMQERLAERGLYEGAAEGDFDEATRAALAAFQEQAGLNATGLPDQPTLMQIMRGGN